MKVLVHYNAEGTDPLGLWWVDPKTNSPQCLYVRENSPEAIRGRAIVFNRAPLSTMTWLEWFDSLVERPPYFELWAAFDSRGMTPEEMFGTFSGR